MTKSIMIGSVAIVLLCLLVMTIAFTVPGGQGSLVAPNLVAEGNMLVKSTLISSEAPSIAVLSSTTIPAAGSEIVAVNSSYQLIMLSLFSIGLMCLVVCMALLLIWGDSVVYNPKFPFRALA